MQVLLQHLGRLLSKRITYTTIQLIIHDLMAGDHPKKASDVNKLSLV